VQIDFFTLVAQLLNFIILVYLLKRILYGRIIRAMDNRQNRINSQLEEAGRKKKEAEQEAETLRAKQRELDESREKILDEARRDAESQQREWLNRARAEVDAEQARWEDALRNGREAFFYDLREHIGREVLFAARKVLRDLSGDDLERRIAESFAGRIRNLDEGRRNELRQIMEHAGNEVVIRSAGTLPEDVRGLIAGAVRETLDVDPAVRFEQAAELVNGIEMQVDGSKLAWSIGSYLDDLDEYIGRVYDSGAGEKGGAEAAASGGADRARPPDVLPQGAAAQAK
jgi:F-type H+-transporting ATPase subunit b